MPTTKGNQRLTTPLAAAVAHPVRARCLVVMSERVASPVEIAREMNYPVTKIGYHVKTLLDAGLIEVVMTRPVRGAVEHFYRATLLPIVDDEQEEERTDDERRAYAETIVSVYAANAAFALDAGTFQARKDHHLTRFAFDLDETGWEEATEAHMELYNRMWEIREKAAKRLADDAKPVKVISFQSLFEIPPVNPA